MMCAPSGISAQPNYGQEALVSMADMLRYQYAKSGKGKVPVVAPFKKFGMRHIRASKVLEEGDERTLWGYRVGANMEYDKSRQPLYRLFKKNDFASLAVIDYSANGSNKCELVFWGKKYYRRFAHELRRMGFGIRNSSTQTNVLEFRKKDTDVGVDVTIWPDIYIMTFLIIGGK